MRRPDLPAKSDYAVLQIHRSVQFAGKSGRRIAGSYKWCVVSEAGFLDDLQTHLLQQFVHVNELREAFVLGLTMEEAVVDLLHDTCKTKQAVGVVEVEVVDLDASALGVVIDELLSLIHI